MKSHILVVFLTLATAFLVSNGKGTIVIYWGTYEGEGSLASACDSGNYGIVVLSFLSQFGAGRTPHLELAHCDSDCTAVGRDVQHCQSKGVKVFLSLGGADGKYSISSSSDAKAVADYLWNNYLGGNVNSKTRPLGKAVLDGIDFDIESGSSNNYAALAREIKKRNPNVLLGAAPQCPFPDDFVGPGGKTALQTGLFDFVWVQFYNNPDCHYNPGKSLDNVFDAWDTWSKIPAKKVLFGLPASLSGATDSPSTKDGYMPPDVLVDKVLPRIKKSSKYGGVMLWSYYYDTVKRDGLKQPFSTTIKNDV